MSSLQNIGTSDRRQYAMLGLKHDVNILADYTPAWTNAFAAERARIAAVLGKIAKGIEHYGSTSIPGMRAKPIIDILVGVQPLSDWKLYSEPLARLGYALSQEADIPGHHVFGKGRDTTERTHLLHVVEFMGESWRSNLAIRDTLRRDPALCREYLAAKEAAAAGAPHGRKRYHALKRSFIERTKANLDW
jgi:GrpB-like predicted nucleotidyltransferase (UPF0157 family)